MKNGKKNNEKQLDARGEAKPADMEKHGSSRCKPLHAKGSTPKEFCLFFRMAAKTSFSPFDLLTISGKDSFEGSCNRGKPCKSPYI